MRRAFLILGATLAGPILAPFSAMAWYDHTVVMDRALIRLEREFPKPGENLSWTATFSVPAIDTPTRYYDIASLLLLQSLAAKDLPSANARTLHDLLRLGAEDPDHGMDTDLPDSADPSDDRKYMGGTKGSGSTGFRHMFWAGWNWRRPIASFQIPTRAMGQAPDRIDLLANEARDFFRKGDPAWGARILGWAIHYLQDLSQPFHVAEVPSFTMAAWSSLFAWPPSAAIDSFLRETSRIVTNYHWAYEGYVRQSLLAGEASPFRECFEKSGGSILVSSPRELALEIASRSAKRARETGEAIVALVGTGLKDPAVTVPLDPKQVDNDDLLKNPNFAEARARLDHITCESLRDSTDATIWITRWALAR